MTLIGIQTRYREAGRIRLGDRGGNRNAPRRLDRFRLTSTDEQLLTQAQRVYGGELSQWDKGYQLYIASDRLDIMMPPSAVAQYSQYWEQWTAGACLRRCNGETELQQGQPCICLQENGGDMGKPRTCKPTTRIGFILQKLGTLGIWRMDTGSFYAAAELPSTVQMLMKAADHFGGPVPAILRIDPRETKSRVNGKVQTRKFAVPVIDITGEFSMEDIMSQPDRLAGPSVSHDQLSAQPQAQAIEAPKPTNVPVTEGEMKSVLAQMREAGVTDEERHGIIAGITGGRTESTKELFHADVLKLREAVGNRMKSRALDELRKRFDNPEEGYAFLTEQGITGSPNDWLHITWHQVYQLLASINEGLEGESSDES